MLKGPGYKVAAGVSAIATFANTPDLSNSWALVASVITGFAVFATSTVAASVTARLAEGSLHEIGIKDVSDFDGIRQARARMRSDVRVTPALLKLGFAINLGLVVGAFGGYYLVKPFYERLLPHRAVQKSETLPSRPEMVQKAEDKAVVYTPKSC